MHDLHFLLECCITLKFDADGQDTKTMASLVSLSIFCFEPCFLALMPYIAPG